MKTKLTRQQTNTIHEAIKVLQEIGQNNLSAELFQLVRLPKLPRTLGETKAWCAGLLDND